MTSKSNPICDNKKSSDQKGKGSCSFSNKKKVLRSNSSSIRRKPIYKTDFQKKIISQIDTVGDKFCCKICPGQPKLLRKNVDNHCLNSIIHLNQITKDQEKDNEELLQKIRSSMEKNKKGKGGKISETNEDIRNYLEFLTFCFKENFSFLQINALGNFLRGMLEKNKLSIFQNFSFDLEEVGKATNCIGNSLLKEIKDNISLNPFSLCVDNVTVSGTSILGIQVKYLKEYIDFNGLPRHSIENTIIGLKHLQESSNAKVLFSAVEEKVFGLGEGIKENLMGISHDRASVFTGNENGLDTLIQENKGSYLFSLNDPCHGLNLVLNKSILLFKEEVKFVEDMSQHFSSSQRDARLQRIQKENGLKILSNKKYIKTRWLSLGASFSRLLEIWDSVELYMKQKSSYPGVPKEKYDEFIKLMQDKVFKLNIICLGGIINKKLNKSNLKWQHQKLEIHNLKAEMIQCIRDISHLFINPNDIPMNIADIERKEWENEENIHKYFLNNDEFIKNLIREIDPALKELLSLDLETQNKFSSNFQKYLAKVLSLLIIYLPIDDKIVDTLDFVSLTQPLSVFKEKVLSFNDQFRIIPAEQIPELSDEINLIMNQDILWMKALCKESSLYLWDMIQGTSSSETGNLKYPLLNKVFKVAHSLPTSSACLEQTFSCLKLVKNNLRNKLHENTTQSLLLVIQRFKDEEIVISDDMIMNYENMKIILNVRKTRNRLLIEKVPEENQEMDENEQERKEMNQEATELEEKKDNQILSIIDEKQEQGNNSSFLQDMTEDQHELKSENEKEESKENLLRNGVEKQILTLTDENVQRTDSKSVICSKKENRNKFPKRKNDKYAEQSNEVYETLNNPNLVKKTKIEELYNQGEKTKPYKKEK